MRQVLSVIGVLASLGFLAASAILNFLFGASLAKDPIHSLIYGAVSVSAVACNAVCPFFIAWSKHKPVLKASASVLWGLCIIFAISSALGFAAKNRYLSTESQLSLNTTYAETLRRLQDLEATRRNYTKPPQALETRIDTLRKELSDLRNRSALTPADPQADFISSLIHTSQHAVRTALIVLFGLIVEIGASLGLYISLAHGAFQKPKAKPESKPKVWRPKTIRQ